MWPAVSARASVVVRAGPDRISQDLVGVVGDCLAHGGLEGIIYRYRTGIPWRDLPREAFGPWQTVSKRHRRWATDGTWDTVLAQLTARADSINGIDWTVSVDSTINRAHLMGIFEIGRGRSSPHLLGL